MAFMALKIIVFENYKIQLNFARFLIFFYFLNVRLDERSYDTLLALQEGSNEHILRGRIWLYGFDNVFPQVLVEFLFASILFGFLFATAIKTE